MLAKKAAAEATQLYPGMPSATTKPAARPLRVDAVRLPLVLLVIAVGLVACHVFTQVWLPQITHGHGGTDRLRRFFDLDAEGNLPSWYSATLWTLAALLAWGASAQRDVERHAARRWVALGVLYLFLSMDEMAAFHEMLGIMLRRIPAFPALFHYAWIAYGIVLVLASAAYFGPFVLRLPRYITICIAIAAAVYLSGALCLEFVAGKVRDGVLHYPFGLTEFYEIIVEEFLEMAGVIILIHGLLVFLRQNDPARSFTIEVAEAGDGR